jgi:hypothetical protein
MSCILNQPIGDNTMRTQQTSISIGRYEIERVEGYRQVYDTRIDVYIDRNRNPSEGYLIRGEAIATAKLLAKKDMEQSSY